MKIGSIIPRILLACWLIALGVIPAPVQAQTLPSEIQQYKPTWPPRPEPVLADIPPASPQAQAANTCSSPWGYFTEIVFMSYRDVKWEIYLRDACSSSPIALRLTNNSNFDGYPRIDSALSRIVFVSDRDGNDELYSMDLAGSNVQRMTTDPGTDTYPAWSPDGTQIVFVSDRGGDPDLYLMDRDGANVRLLLHLDGLDSDPAWSPDGKKITWAHWTSETSGEIYSLDLDSGVSLPLTGTVAYPSRPAWSPDGKYLAYSADMNDDGWLDLAWMTLPDQAPHWRSCASMRGESCDFRMGGFWPEGAYALGSQVMFVKNGSTWYVREAGITRVSLTQVDYEYPMQYSQLDYAPDSASTDTAAPASRVLPMPEYSPAYGYNLRVAASDQGAGGLETVYVYGKKDSSQDWTNYYYKSFEGHPSSGEVILGPLSGTPGDTLYFSSQAIDGAAHYESMHAVPDTFTRLYGWAALGQVADQREHPLDMVHVNLNSASMNTPVSDSTGALNAYFSADGAYDATLTRPGYIPLPSLRWQSQYGKDIRFSSILPSGSNLLQNGQFEDTAGALSGWQISGGLTAARKTGHTGTGGAAIGPDCASSLCLAPRELISEDYANNPSLAVTPDGQVHLVTEWVYGNELVYYHRDAAGQWSAGEQIAVDAIGSSANLDHSDLVADPSGNLAMLYIPSSKPLTLLYKPLGEPWASQETPLNANTFFVARFDAGGCLHVLYADNLLRLYYSVWDPNGSWSAPRLIDENTKAQSFDLAPAPDGTVHFAFFGPSGGKFTYIRLLPNGELTVPEVVPSTPLASYYWYPVRLFLAPGGSLHLVVGGESFLYQYRSSAGIWSSMQFPLSDVSPYASGNYRGAAMDSAGNLQVFLYTSFYDNNQYNYRLYVMRKPADRQTFDRYDLGADLLYNNTYLFTDAGGADHMVMAPGSWTKNIYYRRVVISDQPAMGSLSQTITISAEIYKPTLSFLYQYDQFQPSGKSVLDIELTPQNGSPISLLTLKDGGGWKHAWADLSSWKGQTVTLTFRLNQAAGETPARVSLDEIVVSAWTSLFIHSVEVSASQPILDWWSAPVNVTVNGENFAESIVVRLGGKEIPFTRLSENELTFTVPADFLPGKSSLVLENPGGVQAIAPEPIRLGLQVFLPLLER